MRASVLVVAGRPERREALAEALPTDVRSTTAEGALDALKQLRDTPVDCVVAASALPDGPVEGFVDRVRGTHPTVPVLVVGEAANSREHPRLVDSDGVERLESTEDLPGAFQRATFDRSASRAIEDHERLRGALLALLADLIEAESRVHVERAVHDRLSATPHYRTVWVGEYDASAGELTLRAPATGLVDAGSIADGAAVPLLERLDRETVAASAGDGPAAPGVAVVAFVNGDTRHGLVVLVSDRPHAFDATERALLDRLGDTVGAVLDRLDRDEGSVSTFAETLLHELRNPLGAARAHVDIARESGDADSFDHVETALDRLEDLVENLSALAGLEEPKDAQPCRLGSIVRDAWAPIEAPGANLVVDEDVTVEADPDLLELLLSNLFRNAVDHAGEDVQIRVGAVDDGFYVADDGPGIPRSKRHRVFERGFTGGDGGQGIGLYLVRAVADAHGWSVDVERSQEVGLRFTVTGAAGDDV